MSKKDISVNFCYYEPYENIPATCKTLGYIDASQAMQLMDTLAGHVAPEDACIKSMSTEYRDHFMFGHQYSRESRYRSIDMSSMFAHLYYKRYDEEDTENPIPPCMTEQSFKRKRTELAMTQACARNLANGKCCDPFICKTLGALLYPQFYAQQKQK